MADEEKPETLSTQTGTQPGATSERTFTQAEVDEIVKNRMRKEFKREAKRQEEKSNPRPDKPGRRELDERKADKSEVKSEVDKVLERTRELERKLERSEFNNMMSSDGRFREDAYDDVHLLFTAQKPTDTKAWRDGLAAKGAFLRQPKQETATPVNGDAAKEAPAATTPRGASAPAAPSVQSAHPTIDGGLVDIWNLSDAQIASLGPRGLRVEYEKILARRNELHGVPPRPQAPHK